jgi:hypothetical protein
MDSTRVLADRPRGWRAFRRGRGISSWLCGLLALGAAALPLRALADIEDEEPHDASSDKSIRSANDGMFLPNTIAPSLGKRAASAVGLGGYDSGLQSAVMSMQGEVHVYGPVDLRLGLNYTPNTEPGVARAEPQFGVRFHLLSQERNGIEGAALINYRLDRYTPDDGEIQAMFVLGRRFGRAGVFLNLGYGQDPEGDDHDGEAALSAIYALSEPLQLGFESHARFNLFSTDPRRAARHEPNALITTGPTLHYGLGPCVLLAQVGMSTLVGIDRTRVGAVALAGVGAAY